MTLVLTDKKIAWWLVIRNGSPIFAIQAKDKNQAMERSLRAFMYFPYKVDDEVIFKKSAENDMPYGIYKIYESYFNLLESLNIKTAPEDDY